MNSAHRERNRVSGILLIVSAESRKRRKIEILFLFYHVLQLQTMFRISPSRKDIAAATAAITATNPVTIWTTQHQFRFHPAHIQRTSRPKSTKIRRVTERS